MLDVHALDRADPLREVEDLGLGERRGREPAAVLLPDHGRVEALLDRRPDREGGGEVVALDDEVRAVADADLVDLGEELVGGVAGEDVGGAGLDADADEREQALLLPRLGALELVVAELDAGLLVRVRRMRLGERHRHVEVRHAGLEARVEDRDVEERVDRVEDGVGSRLADQRDDRVLARRVDPRAPLKRPSSSSADDALPAAPGRSRRARSARRTSAAAAICAKAEPTPPVPTTRIRTAHGFYTNDPGCSAARAAGDTLRRDFPERRSDVSVVGNPAEAVHRRRVRGLDVGRDDGGAEPGDRRGDRRGAARDRRGRRARGRRGEEGVGRVAGARRRRTAWSSSSKLADVIDENAEELARLESLNVGKPWWVAVDEPGVDVGQPPLLRRAPRGTSRARPRPSTSRATRR